MSFIFQASQKILSIKYKFYINNTNKEWYQYFQKPTQFSNWQKLPKIIENLYE